MAVPKVVYRGKPKPNSWAKWFVGRTMRNNNNNLVSVIGKTGSGKTWSAISICEIMSELDGVPFGVEHIVFSLKELMDLINSGTLKRGSKIIFDEPQCSISAREFQSEANKVFNFLLSTFRHRNLSLFFCTPFESLLDKNTRRLFHCRIETLSVNHKKNTCRLKPRYLEYSDFKAEPYRKQLIVIYKDKEMSSGYKADKLFFWDIPKPSKDLIEKYEAKKLAFTNKLNENISARLQKYEDSGKSMTAEQKAERKPLTDRQRGVMELLAQGLTQQQVADKTGLEQSAVSRHKIASEKKGYTIQEFSEEVENKAV